MRPASFASVLVIDDEPVVLDLFQRVLTEKGLSTRLARNAEEALALLEREEFGCVLADKNLPGLNGIEVLRRVGQTQPYCACIIMTAYASTQSAVEALRIGALDYIEKPFDDLDSIADRIDEAVKQMKIQYERRAAVTPLRLIDSQGAANELPEESDPAEAMDGDREPATPIEILQSRVQHATSDSAASLAAPALPARRQQSRRPRGIALGRGAPGRLAPAPRRRTSAPGGA